MFARPFVLAALCIALMTSVPVPAEAAPPPPPQLMEVFSALIEIEEQVEAKQWTRARKALAMVSVSLDQIKDDLVATVPREQRAALLNHQSSFRLALESRDPIAAYSAFLALHQDFLHTMENFAYKLPPLLFLIRNDLEEASAAVEEGDFEELADEIEQLKIFYRDAIPTLSAKGIGEKITGAFTAKIAEARDAAAGDRDRARTTVAELQRLFDLQYSLYTSS